MEEKIFGGEETIPSTQARPVFPAMMRGFRGKCPHCGEGKLFRAFLKTDDSCPACNEEFSHHRADDLPAYLVIVIVGHMVLGAFMGIESVTQWSPWLHLAIWVPITILASILLIGPVKGAIVGLQWALRMHGFGEEDDGADTLGTEL